MTINLDTSTFEQYCQTTWKPWLVGGFLTTWLTQHFSVAENIEDTQLQDFVWTDDYRTSKLLIDNATRWDPKAVGQRPAIILKRGPTQNQRLGIADRMFNYKNLGSQFFTTFWVGSHSLFCLAKSGAEAEHLGTEVAREINQFAWTLARSLNLFKLQVAQVGALSKLEEATENFVVVVVVTYAYEEAWQVNQEAPVLNNIKLSFFEP